ncbi:metalloregulator ArsR/SmtB family transcription factor [Hahella sp. KA22]|uniref:ArsR/SmtB family transcription factor n=1 Tax=Hahella sp. KA22 TaxID=1628392 RepID=UPI000FDEDF4B|nr:metalloregulator ArsR/SmtB family transcription factor [Hahella sp. KA22]AZZ91941.1 ArsR family transcriptional regulator [Hahella sp. KA22]QAY55312.1 metalloregulator ArsR/SmtB family transcription factor [Hahella sp. KA22]
MKKKVAAPHSSSPTPLDLMGTALNAEAAAALMQALSNPHRLMILCALSEGERRVSELNEFVELSQSALSQHLAVLRHQQLVHTRKQAQTVYYSVAEGPAMAIVKLLHRHYCSNPASNPTIQGEPHDR